MNQAELGFDETVELLSNILAPRALHLLEDQNYFDSCRLLITDESINIRLDEAGIHRYQIVREAVKEILESKGIDKNYPKVFDVVDGEFREDTNPLIEHVREIFGAQY